MNKLHYIKYNNIINEMSKVNNSNDNIKNISNKINHKTTHKIRNYIYLKNKKNF